MLKNLRATDATNYLRIHKILFPRPRVEFQRWSYLFEQFLLKDEFLSINIKKPAGWIFKRRLPKLL
jgi:hypothetical protein